MANRHPTPEYSFCTNSPVTRIDVLGLDDSIVVRLPDTTPIVAVAGGYRSAFQDSGSAESEQLAATANAAGFTPAFTPLGSSGLDKVLGVLDGKDILIIESSRETLGGKFGFVAPQPSNWWGEKWNADTGQAIRDQEIVDRLAAGGPGMIILSGCQISGVGQASVYKKAPNLGILWLIAVSSG